MCSNQLSYSPEWRILARGVVLGEELAHVPGAGGVGVEEAHGLLDVAVELDGDVATARTYVDAVLLMPDGASGINAIGFYDDELVRTPDGWRISRRAYTSAHMAAVGG